MTAPYRKKLIEVALPLKAINEASAREKSIRHGHPSTLHLWWARRPLAACRAVLFASLVDDPDSDPAYRKADGTVDEENAGVKRAQLFNLIEELVRWENSNNPRVINAARAEIARCVASRKIELGEFAKDTIIFGDQKGQKHPKGPIGGDGTTAWEIVLMKAKPEIVNAFLVEHAPPVLDPFCGGGSIPLEAQRLGLRAYASDLNPVPVLITKALIEIPPKFAGQPPVNPEWQRKSDEEKAATVWQGAQGLAEDVRYYGKWMRDEAEKRIGHLYPKVKITKEMAKDRPDLAGYVGQELTVIAWLWARTVASPNPACGGAHVPLVRSFWLSTKKGNEAYVRPSVERDRTSYRFDVKIGRPQDGFDPSIGTVSRNGGLCLLTQTPISLEYIRAEGKAGRIRSSLLAIVAEGRNTRLYIGPTSDHEERAKKAIAPNQVPDTDLPEDALGFRIQNYGITKHRQMFTDRQQSALSTFSDLISEARNCTLRDGQRAGLCNSPSHAGVADNRATAYANAVATYLAFAVDKAADYWSAFCSWHTSGQKMRNTFGRSAMPMVWDFAECNPWSNSTGNWTACVDWVWKVIARLLFYSHQGHVEQLDASAASLACPSAPVFSTDPPYYDNVPYADLSDFFYVWLRRSLSGSYPQLLSTVLVPKAQELVAEPFRHGGRDAARTFFEQGIHNALLRMRDKCSADHPATIFYAFKQAEDEDNPDADGGEPTFSRSSTGWETFLQGLSDAGWQIDGTWPMRTELGNRMRGLASNALASSVVLVCRPRSVVARLATRKELINALRQELPEALKNLQHGNIAPVDMAQSAIGPGMAVFTRHSKVIESDGSPMTVRTALGIINQVLDEVLAEQEGDFDADTRWALAWFEQFGMQEETFGMAETLSKAKNTAVNGLVEAGVVKAKAGKVRLVKRTELAEDWDPAIDKRLTIWETTQHLIRILQTKGESEAAVMLNKLGGLGETARELAYRLYSICERKKWADEALAYNSLVIAWPELSKLALASRNRQAATQQELFS